MAENVEGHRGRRGRRLGPAAVLAAATTIVVWIVRSRRVAAADIGTGWPPPRPTGAGAEYLRPEEVRRQEVPVGPRPRPAPVAAGASTKAGSSARRPSPRPRKPASAAVPSHNGLPPGAAASLPDGSPPGPEYTIKGNAGSMIFHPPTSPYFARTKAQYWFRTAEEARAAGFTEWTPRRR